MELMARDRSKAPPRLDESIATARNFYQAHRAEPLFDHTWRVLQKACSVGIVEPKVIADAPRDMKRAWINSDLAEIILYHVVEFERAKARGIPLPTALCDEAIQRELTLFSELTRLDRSGAELRAYRPVLNNGHAPLALPARQADYAVTHNMEERLEGLVTMEGSTMSPIFRMYASAEEARQSMRAEAKAGELIYAPTDELFGYPLLAGDTLQHAYSVNHRAIYDHVMKSLGADQLQSQVMFTRFIVENLAQLIEMDLAGRDITATIMSRPEKHPGKIMRKIYRLLRYEWKDSEEKQKGMALDDYIDAKVGKFDLATRLNDMVALRVILDKFRGEDVDALEAETGLGPMGEVNTTILDTMDRLLGNLLHDFDHAFEFKDKGNGYKAFHIDVEPIDEPRATRFEIQAKIWLWHDVAEHGGAAHHYYVGGNREFMDMVADTYRDIIHANGNCQK